MEAKQLLESIRFLLVKQPLKWKAIFLAQVREILIIYVARNVPHWILLSAKYNV